MPPRIVTNPELCVEQVLERVGRRIVLGTPLGIGKPHALLNALYRRAQRDPSLRLDVITGLCLAPPDGKSELEKRFYAPIRARVWGAQPPFDLLTDAEAGNLPDNVRLIEFYVRAGSILGDARRQQTYISSNYSHVARDMVARGLNLVMQAVALREQAGSRSYSWSGNPDVTRALLPLLAASEQPCLKVVQVNRGLPWLGNACAFEADEVDLIVDDPALDHPPFAVPHEPVDLTSWAIGLRAGALVKDGGTLQVGIGALGDAACHALRLRQQDAASYRALLDALGRDPVAAVLGGDGGFDEGLYAASELVSYPLFVLFEEGIVRRRVYEDLGLQQQALVDPGKLPPDAHGTALQGAFFVGPAAFYQKLHALPEAQRSLIDMSSVAEVNRVFTDYRLEHLQRRHARLLNITLKATLLGAAASDQLEDGKVLSGVGGQSDFVNMAHQLPGARSALLLRATSQRGGTLESNVIWQYGHTTIPRHMRDLFITEYGVADLRGKTDQECIEAMLAIADSRFQEGLLAEAQRAGKLPKDARIPDAARENLPARIARALAPFGKQLPALPFGSDITEAEWKLGARLKKLAGAANSAEGKLAIARALALPAPAEQPEVRAALAHLDLATPAGPREQLLARLVRAAYRL